MKKYILFFTVLALIFACVPAAAQDAVKVPILLYHNLSENGGAVPRNLHVTPQRFAEQLDRLKSEGYTTIDFRQYRDYVIEDAALPEKPIIIAFDDGYTSNYTYAYPLLAERGMKATIFAITGRMGAWDTDFPHFTWAQAQEMQESGVIDIQSHSDFHSNFSLLPPDKQVLELRRSRYLLQTKLHKSFFVLAYPYGLRNSYSKDIARAAGFAAQCLVGDYGYNSRERTWLEDLTRLTVSGDMGGDDLMYMINKNLLS